MTRDLGLDEIFSFARELEENHANFYARAAAAASLPRVRRLLDNLAQKEREHERVFAVLAARLPATGSNGAGEEAAARARENNLRELRDMVRDQVFGRKVRVADHLRAGAGVQEVLALALRAENLSAEFYAMLGATTDGDEVRDIVERILEEEMKHVEFLNEVRARIGG